MFDKISKHVPSFDALPRGAWRSLGILELVCALGLVVPAAFQWHPNADGAGSSGLLDL